MKGGAAVDGGKFVIVGVGDEPTSPLTRTPAPVAPVTAELPRTPNCLRGAEWRGHLGPRGGGRQERGECRA